MLVPTAEPTRAELFGQPFCRIRGGLFRMDTRLTWYQAHDSLSIHSSNEILYGVVEGSFPIL